jgi:hypothetical protein
MQLKDFRGVKTIGLKSLPGSQIEIYDGILFGDSGKVVQLQKSPEDTTKALDVLTVVIKDWNFTDSNSEKLPINSTNINLLSPEAIQELLAESTSFILSKKKE